MAPWRSWTIEPWRRSARAFRWHAPSQRREGTTMPSCSTLFLLLLLCLLDLGPGVPQRHRPVKDGRLRRRVFVHAEVAQPLELVAAPDRRAGQAGLQLAAAEHLQRVRIEVRQVVRSF